PSVAERGMSRDLTARETETVVDRRAVLERATGAHLRDETLRDHQRVWEVSGPSGQVLDSSAQTGGPDVVVVEQCSRPATELPAVLAAPPGIGTGSAGHNLGDVVDEECVLHPQRLEDPLGGELPQTPAGYGEDSHSEQYVARSEEHTSELQSRFDL